MRRIKTALIILDMINLFDFPEASQLLPQARRVARNILRLKEKLKRRGYPVVYVNDHFGNWHADWKRVFDLCSAEESPGKEIAFLLRPQEDDYFILKPKHSGFHLTSLDLLLKELRIKKLILTGIAGNLCVLFTAYDAHMRDYEILVPRDCVASNDKKDNQFALRQIEKALKLSVQKSREI